jgi:signal transduction histidine kinase
MAATHEGNTEHDLRAAREQMSIDLRRMTRLHEASTRIGGPADPHEALQEILRAAVDITGAEMGYIQSFDDTGVLSIAAQAGFEPPLVFSRPLMEVASASRDAMSSRQRVTVEDLAASQARDASPFLDVLAGAGVRAMQSTPLFDRAGTFVGTLSTHYRGRHEFDDAERRWLDLLAPHAEHIIQRRLGEALLARATSELERRVEDRTKWLTLVHNVTRALNDAPSWDEGLRLVLRRICETEHWQIGYVYLPDRDDPDVIVPAISFFSGERFRPFHAASEKVRFTRGQSLAGGVWSDGLPRWVNDQERLCEALLIRQEAARQVGLQAAIALPLRSGQEVVAVLELFSDQADAPNDLLRDVIDDIGAQIGKLLERERTTANMADLVWEEQQGLLHTLHDSLGQTLTGLGMLASGLSRSPVAGPEHDVVTKITQLSQQALEQVRQLSRGLFPIEVDPEGLMPMLRELASTTESFHRIHVTVEGNDPASIADCRVATQLYRIAQEAVTNVVKHAQASAIAIALRDDAGVTQLRISDNGVGITDPAARGEGLGLRIMNYRATSLGGTLSIERGSGGGTIVTCLVRGGSVGRRPRP